MSTRRWVAVAAVGAVGLLAVVVVGLALYVVRLADAIDRERLG